MAVKAQDSFGCMSLCITFSGFEAVRQRKVIDRFIDEQKKEFRNRFLFAAPRHLVSFGCALQIHSRTNVSTRHIQGMELRFLLLCSGLLLLLSLLSLQLQLQ